MPNKLRMTLHILEKYTKNQVVIQPTSVGVAFSQNGDRNKKNYEHYDKEFWKEKKCYNFRKTGHPASHCLNNSKETSDKNQDEKKSRTSRTIKSSRSKKLETNKLNKEMKKSITNLEEKYMN